MSELGRRLKEERERKQLSLEDLQKETKIQKRYLSAIEEGRFDILPGRFYARAFIKNYAEVLGLDPEELLQEFSHEVPNPTKEIEEIPSRSERSRQKVDRKAKRKNSFITTLIGFAVILVLFIGIYLVVQAVAGEKSEEITQEDSDTNFEGDFSNDLPKEEKTADEDAEDESSVVDVDEPQVTDEEEHEEVSENTSQELTFIETVGNRSFYELSNINQFLVTIEYSGECYVDIKNGKGHLFESGIKKAGDTQQFDFSEEEEITFNFGASPNVKLKINDEELSLPLNTHVQRITVKFKGIEN